MTTKKNTRGLIRHGDVFLRPIGKLPENVKPKDETLALGEVTGHAHKMIAGQFQVYGNADQIDKQVSPNEMEQWVVVDKEAILDHQQHGQIPVDAGVYEVLHQRQYNTYNEEVRRVQD